ncbi:MAG TPA: N-acetylmuramidase family protein [Rhodocyclaceae bacterium]|nr:N-acetylmuramidase family protein [Rhodocyclaceae bacterium]
MRKGDTGSEVKDLQRLLGTVGLPLILDGWYGETTEAAVKAFQQRVGLVTDGIAGPKTLQLLRTRDKDPRLLTQAALEKAASRLGVQVAAVMSVNEVESLGQGFLDDGRPVILYERHVMAERLEARGIDPAPWIERYPALINSKRGGYAGGAAEYARLASAKSINQEAALESCSWGQFQIMGYHWKDLGYDSIEAFVDAMQRSENDQLEAFTRFIEADPALLKALKGRKWADFARIYNGSAYKENLYDVKLARAYERHSPQAPEQEAA